MAETRFKAFLSCSFSEEDRDLVDFFVKLINSFDIYPMVYDYQEIGKLSSKIQEHILKSDCLIALALRKNKIEGTDFWSCSDWIQHEIAIAIAANKPVAIFVEDGVRIEGLIATEERRQRISRTNLLRDMDKITAFLFSLRKFLEQEQSAGIAHCPLLFRHYIVSKEILTEEVTKEKMEISMEALIEGLEAVPHSVEIEEATSGLSIKPFEFDFRCLEKPANVRVEPMVILSTDLKFLWKVCFNPPLKKGDKVKYSFKYILPNYRPFTYEELIKRIEEGTYEYKEPKVEACEWEINFPTYELRDEFEFPDKYEIENYYPAVYISEARIFSEKETQRIIEGSMFSAEEIFDKWVLKLHVRKPLLNHIYYTYYTPSKNIGEIIKDSAKRI